MVIRMEVKRSGAKRLSITPYLFPTNANVVSCQGRDINVNALHSFLLGRIVSWELVVCDRSD